MLTARKRARWRFAGSSQICEDKTPAPSPADGPDALLRRLLAQRGFTTPEAAAAFLNPKLKDLADPADLPGCRRAAARLARAVAQRQPIVIYGDYDVDGVTATAILWHLLRHLGHPAVRTYVPHRLDEGYGLSPGALDQIAESSDAGVKPLVVTVDCGITAVAAADHARKLGLELIITDHHEFDADDLPDAAALVHPGLDAATSNAEISGEPEEHGDAGGTPATDTADPSSPSPLCGAGVAFKLAWQTARTHFNTDHLPGQTKRLLLDLLAYAALGTVADVVPLVGENRVIVSHGLSRIKDTPFLGLNALIDAAELRTQKVDAYHVGFVLGPRLNACGRMGHARRAVTLLTDASPQHAKELADFLTTENDRRRATERQILGQARAMVEERGDDAEDRRAIVLAHEDWHPGVIGIVASRLVEAYHRPVILLGIDAETGLAKGSARSVDGLDLHAAISRCAHHCSKFGGHAMAAGLTLPAERVEAFRDELIAVVNENLSPEDLVPTVTIDAEVGLHACGLPLVQQLDRLTPFGRANPRPRLLVRGAITARPGQRMGREGKHLSLSLRDERGTGVRAVGFGLGDLADDLPAGVTVDVVVQPKANTWRGVTTAELHVVDLRSAETPDAAAAQSAAASGRFGF
jgi:single-stranded-DNA-specific exonuclease